MTTALDTALRQLATNVLAYFTIAYLVGYLAERTARVEKKLVEKTESELIEDQVKMDHITTELRHIEHSIDELKKHTQGPRLHL